MRATFNVTKKTTRLGGFALAVDQAAAHLQYKMLPSDPNRQARTLGLPVGLPGSSLYLE